MVKKIFEQLNNYWLTEDYNDNFGFGLDVVTSKYTGLDKNIYIYQDYMQDKTEYSPFIFIIIDNVLNTIKSVKNYYNFFISTKTNYIITIDIFTFNFSLC